MKPFFENELLQINRRDKSLVAELKVPHYTIASSFENGGSQTHCRFVVNNQCVEGKKHISVAEKIVEMGQKNFQARVCKDLSLPENDTILMTTAANMQYATI